MATGKTEKIVRIKDPKRPGGRVINLSDFNEDEHDLFDAEAPVEEIEEDVPDALSVFGESTAEALSDAGFDSLREVADAEIAQIQTTGMTFESAQKTIFLAREALGEINER